MDHAYDQKIGNDGVGFSAKGHGWQCHFGKACGTLFFGKKGLPRKDALILKDLENGGIVFDAETGWYRIRILPEDTEKLDFGKYFFDIRKKDDTGEKYLCPMTELEICPVVTHRENMR